MKVLVIGGGGREHAICAALKRSRHVKKLLCAPGNGGISDIAECFPVKATDIDGMINLAQGEGVDYVVIAPDDPLAIGMADAMEKAGIKAFGPKKDAAAIESSKVFSKALMEKYNIPTAKYRAFIDPDAAAEYIESMGAPIVVKADGLALGKGVTVAMSVQEAKDAVFEMMLNAKFGDSGSKVVIEEYLTGPEVTALCFTDGKTIVPMLSSQDHKRAYDGDTGPNTGGMGVICPSPHYTPEIEKRCMDEIFLPTIEAMRLEGRAFKGVLYVGLMLTEKGPKVIEYNARFGDPETQAVLPLLETDLYEIFSAVTEERLSELDIKWKPGASCCIVLASGGYPVSYKTGYEISGLESCPKDSHIFHAGTRKEGGKYLSAGGRVLGAVAVSTALDAAVERAYQLASSISFKDMYYRKDIGKPKTKPV